MKYRRMATRPHYKHSETGEWLTLMGISFIVGAMLGATIALGLMA